MSLSCTVLRMVVPTCRSSVSGSVRGTFSNGLSALTISTTGQTLTGVGSCTAVSSPTLTSTSGAAPVYTFSPTTTITFYSPNLSR